MSSSGTVTLADGGELYYETAGAEISGELSVAELSGHAPLLTLIHPGLWDRRTWDREFDAWSDRFPMLRYDVRGFGRSSRLTGGPYSHARDLEALLDHLGIERTALVGCSMGGGIAIDLALLAPERVVALVLAASALGGFEPTEEEISWFEERTAPVEAAIEAGELERAQDLRMGIWASMGTDDDAGKRIRQIAFENIHELTMDESAELELEPPAVLRLAEIDVPTLVLIAEHDPPFMRRCGELIGREVLDGRIARIEADHVINVRNPGAFEAEVLRFLSDI